VSAPQNLTKFLIDISLVEGSVYLICLPMTIGPQQSSMVPSKKSNPMKMFSSGARITGSTTAGFEASSETVKSSSDHTSEITHSVKCNSGSLCAKQTTYRDYSHVKPDEGAIQMAANKEPTFIVKLHQMLSNPDIEDIISWLPHGRAWRILQRKPFEEQVIPLYFRHCRYSSFMRQVNGWGFRRVTNGSDYNAYYHEMFLRGMPHLCYKMRRLTTKDGGARGRHPKEEDDEPSPDFYRLDEEHPLPESTPVRPPAPPVSYGRASDTAAAGHLPQSGLQIGAPVSLSPIERSLNSAVAPSLVSTEIEAALTARLCQRVNVDLGLLSSFFGRDLGLGNSQFRVQPSSSCEYLYLDGRSSTFEVDSLLARRSMELKEIIRVERQKAAVAELARISAMENLLRLC